MRPRVSRSAPALAGVWATATLTGCLSLVTSQGARSSSGGSRDAVRYNLIDEKEAALLEHPDDLTLVADESECQEFALNHVGVRPHMGRFKTDAPLEAQLASVACHFAFDDSAITEASGYGILHNRFDDRHYDHLQAALIVTLCAAMPHCNGPVATGQVAYYAEETRSDDVRMRLKGVSLRDGFADILLRRFATAQQLVLARADRLDARRTALYRTLPRKVRNQRAAHWKKYARFWQRYDRIAPAVGKAVRAGAASEELTREVGKLRDEYIAACVADGEELPDCFQGQLGRPLTEALVRLAIAAKQPLLGFAENELLELGAEHSTAPMEIFTSQYAAMAEESKRFEEWRRAKESGADPATLAATYGDPPPIQIDAASAWQPQRKQPSYRPLLERLGPEPAWITGEVKSTERIAGGYRLHFRDVVSSWDEQDCVETDRIDRIEDGRIVYRQRCKFKKTHTERRKTPPAIVLGDSRSGLAAGSFVKIAAGEDRRGYLVFSQRGKDRQLLALRNSSAK